MTEQQRENLAIRYNTLLTLDQIARARPPLDRPEALVGRVSQSYMMSRNSGPSAEAELQHEEEEEELIEEDECPESDDDENLTYLLFEPGRELSEEEAQYIWADNSAYKDVRKELQAKKKGRHFFKPKDTKNKKGGGKSEGKGSRLLDSKLENRRPNLVAL